MKFDSCFLPLALALGFAACLAHAQTITTVAGTSEAGFDGDGGPAILAHLNGVTTLSLDAQGNLYISDGINIRVRKVTPSGVITTVAGSGDISSTVEGSALATGFLSIYGIAAAPDGTLYIADAEGLQKVDPQGNLSFVVTDSSIPGGIRISGQGVFYTGNIAVISQLNPDQSQVPVAGSDLGDSGDGGPATQALFTLTDFTTDSVGDIYFTDNGANRVRKFTPGGNINAVAGNGTNDFGGDGGLGDPGPVEQSLWNCRRRCRQRLHHRHRQLSHPPRHPRRCHQYVCRRGPLRRCFEWRRRTSLAGELRLSQFPGHQLQCLVRQRRQ